MTGDADGVWTLLTGHGHVLVAIAKNPDSRVRDLSREAGLTERTTQGIINDLEAAGYISRHRAGRRTTYTVHPDRAFRHSAQEGLVVGPFLEVLGQTSDSPPGTSIREVRVGLTFRTVAGPTGTRTTARGTPPRHIR